MKVRNLAQFIKQVERMEEQVRRDHTRLHRFVALDLIRRVTLKSPVVSGRFRSAWSVSLDPPDPTPMSASAAAQLPVIPRGQVIRNAMHELEGLRPFSILWAHNSLPYATALESGRSGQAPEGVLAISVAEIEAGFGPGGTS